MADGLVITLTGENFREEVLQSKKPVLVDFWAEWCGPCRLMVPIVEEVARDYGDQLKVGKVNVEESQDLACEYAVMSVPTLILFKDSRPVEKFVGYLPKKELKLRLDKAL